MFDKKFYQFATVLLATALLAFAYLVYESGREVRELQTYPVAYKVLFKNSSLEYTLAAKDAVGLVSISRRDGRHKVVFSEGVHAFKDIDWRGTNFPSVGDEVCVYGLLNNDRTEIIGRHAEPCK